MGRYRVWADWHIADARALGALKRTPTGIRAVPVHRVHSGSGSGVQSSGRLPCSDLGRIVCVARGVPLLRLFLRQYALDGLLELHIDHIEVFRYDFDVGNDGHEIGIAVPAGDDVVMDVFGKACASYFPLVDTHIEAIGCHQLAQGFEGQLRLPHQFGKGGGIQFFERFDVLKWRYHEMPIVVWVAVQHHETTLAAIENVVLGVMVLSRERAKNAPRWWWCLRCDESHAPGRP